MSKIDYRDKTLPLDRRLQELEGGLAMACNDSAADLVREARDALAGAETMQDDLRRRLRKAESDASYHC